MRVAEKIRRCPESARTMKSNVLDQFGDAHLESAGNPAQRGQRNGLLAALDPPHVIGVEIGLFSQLFLAESSMFPLFTDGCAKDDAVIRTRTHHYTQPQTERRLYTVKRMIFLLHWRQYVGQWRPVYENLDRNRAFGRAETPVLHCSGERNFHTTNDKECVVSRWPKTFKSRILQSVAGLVSGNRVL